MLSLPEVSSLQQLQPFRFLFSESHIHMEYPSETTSNKNNLETTSKNNSETTSKVKDKSVSKTTSKKDLETTTK